VARPRILERRVNRFLREPPTVRNAVRVIVSGSLLVVVLAAVVMRVVDRSDFSGLGDALWWSVQTVTTVGYGDITPAHTGGRIVAAIVMLWGIAFIAILTAAITSVFVARAARQYGEAGAAREEEAAGARFDELAARLDRIEELLSRQTPT
jgi:voltage-gated potassium channel